MHTSLSSMLGILALTIPLASANPAGPDNFNDAKRLLREHVYFDQNHQGQLGTLYCGCDWKWTSTSGGLVDLNSCNYQPRALPHRAKRIEWEHIVPVSWLAKQRQCWQQGGREYCREHDPLFNLMEADMHNLSPSIGEVNADRSYFRFGHLPAVSAMYGQCSSRADFRQRVFEPRPEVRGMVARIHLYMHNRYNIRMSRQQQQLFTDWHKTYPVSDWELERDRRISKITGQSNPFVTGKHQWLPGDIHATKPPGDRTGTIRGNSNSKIYHLSHCPSYASVSPNNIIAFHSEQQARKAGYRKARNCK